MSTSHEHAVAGVVQLPRRIVLLALDLGIYGCAFASADVAELLDRVRVDSTFGRYA